MQVIQIIIYQVCQSISTGLLGLGTTLAVAEPIKRGVKKVLANPEKYMKTDVSYVKNNERVFKETAGRLHQPLFLPLRAMLTIAIVPPILKALGLSKTGKPVNVADKTKIDYSFMNFKGNETNKAFKDVANISLVSSKKPSFKGLGGIVTEGIAKGNIFLSSKLIFNSIVSFVNLVVVSGVVVFFSCYIIEKVKKHLFKFSSLFLIAIFDSSLNFWLNLGLNILFNFLFFNSFGGLYIIL